MSNNRDKRATEKEKENKFAFQIENDRDCAKKGFYFNKIYSSEVYVIEGQPPVPSVEEQKKNDFDNTLKKAACGDTTRQLDIATCYFQGYGVQVDLEEAVKWLEKASESNVCEIQLFEVHYRLGICYFYGIGVQTNYKQAYTFFEKCANFNFPQRRRVHIHENYIKDYILTAQCKLAACYFEGYGVEKNHQLAIRWLEKAAEQSNKSAQIKLADCYFEGFGVDQSDENALTWLYKAAGLQEEPIRSLHTDGYILGFTKDGHRLAQRKLAYYFLKKNNYSEAIKWFKEIKRGCKPRSLNFKYTSEEFERNQIELGICYYYNQDNKLAAEEFFSEQYIFREFNGFKCLWSAYLKDIENKPLAEKITPLNRLRSLINAFTATGMSGKSESEIDEMIQSHNTVKKVIDNEKIINEFLMASAVDFFLKKEINFDNDFINYVFSEEIIGFLKDHKSTFVKVILALYYQRKNETEKFLECLEEPSGTDIIICYLLGLHYKSKIDFIKAVELFNVVKYAQKDQYDPFFKQHLTFEAKREIEVIEYLIQIEGKNKQLQEKDKELEDMMSMFAHKFRSPLDTIIYNTTHDNSPKLYAQAAQTMRGLLDIFSIISTDDKILTEKLKVDCQGNARLMTVFNKTLNMILLHLLAVASTEKIQQHYLAFAKAHGKIAGSVTYKEWYDEHFELEQALQIEWEQDFADLLSQSAPLTERLAWLEQHFFKLELIGFDREDIQFKEYAVTESFLIILLNEILINAFKYYSSETHQSVVLEWSEREGKQFLRCHNPSVRRERTAIKGSGKGHAFLSALARKIGGQFFKPKPQDDFVLEFGIPNELLRATSRGE